MLLRLDTALNEKKELFGDAYADIEKNMNYLRTNIHKINEHGIKVDHIVQGMLQHSRGEEGIRQKIKLHAMIDEYLNLSYHGMRAKDTTFNVKLETQFDPQIDEVEVIPQDLSRVFLNMFNNAFYSVDKKQKLLGDAYFPMLRVMTKKVPNGIEIVIRDNGEGIKPELIERIFTPFFTTKPPGEGTGLGLSISYDIITQEHKGKITLHSEEGKYAEFVIFLPDSF